MTDEEREILGLLLAADVEGADALRQQSESVVVVGRCDCALSTIHLRVLDDSVPRVVVSGRLWPVDGRVDASGEATPQEIILFVDDGSLSSLELVFTRIRLRPHGRVRKTSGGVAAVETCPHIPQLACAGAIRSRR